MKIQETSSDKSAYLYAIKLLTKRDYSVFKLERKLSSKGFDSCHIRSAIKEVVQKKFLIEENYATARAKSLMNKGLHPSFIQAKLAEESVSISIEKILSLFDEYGLSTKTQIKNLINKKIRTFDLDVDNYGLQKIEHKLIRYLLTKGHSTNEIREITFELIYNN